jgi:gamma-glutamyltranspeptidase/glutathione hydrolase
VAAGSTQAVAAAVEVLAGGGNAVDAAVAAAAMASVSEPGLSSLGGGGFLLSRDGTGVDQLLDFFVTVPGLPASNPVIHDESIEVKVRYNDVHQPFHVGPGSVAVPGVLDGLVHAHRCAGSLPLADVLEPARRAAATTCVLDVAQDYVLDVVVEVLAISETSRRLWTDAPRSADGRRVVHNPELADVLERLGAGALASIADPALAEPLVLSTGGRLTLDDLAAYAVLAREPLRLDNVLGRGGRLSTNPGPSFGGSVVARALGRYDARQPWALPRLVLDAAVAIKSEPIEGPAVSRGTTHVSVVAPDGSSASLTTSNGASSGLVLEGTGIQLNNMMGEADLRGSTSPTLPGQRLRSMMAPSLLDLPDGSTVVLGSGGSERIRTALTGVVAGIASGSSLLEAIAAPRMHLDDSDVLQVEPSVDEGLVERVVEDLQRHGHDVQVSRWSASDLYFGGVNAVHRRADGSVVAVADHRRGGAVAVVPA